MSIRAVNVIRPKPQESFNKYQRRCPYHTKARCGRCFCEYLKVEEKTNVRCNKYNCPFYGEDSKLIGNKGKRNKYERRKKRRT